MCWFVVCGADALVETCGAGVTDVTTKTNDKQHFGGQANSAEACRDGSLCAPWGYWPDLGENISGPALNECRSHAPGSLVVLKGRGSDSTGWHASTTSSIC